MARAIRLLIVGAPRVGDLIRGRSEASDVEVVGEVSDVSDIAEVAQADVVLVGDPRALDEVGGMWEEGSMPALVVVTDDPRTAQDVGRLGAPGWSIAMPDSTGAELHAAIVAAAHGFASQPVAAVRSHENDDVPLDALTGREREVLELLSEGVSNKAIASRLSISEHTVKFHLASIFSKLGVSSRTEAVRRGVRAGLITL